MMKDLRRRVGQQNGVAPYVVFQDASLEAMATFYPITIEELQNMPGVGSGKANRYGKEFIEVIKRYVEDNEIDRPAGLQVRTLPSKNKNRVAIIQQIDRKVALDDIANSQGLDFNELLTALETIVYNGTKIDISYFLEEAMDEEHIWDIFDYFKEATTDALDEATQELGEDYTEEEIRLVRIKFLSDLAN